MHEAKKQRTKPKTLTGMGKKTKTRKHPQFKIEKYGTFHLPKVELQTPGRGEEFETQLKEPRNVIK